MLKTEAACRKKRLLSLTRGKQPFGFYLNPE